MNDETWSEEHRTRFYAAFSAIRRLFSDTSVSTETTRETLQRLQEEIGVFREMLNWLPSPLDGLK